MAQPLRLVGAYSDHYGSRRAWKRRRRVARRQGWARASDAAGPSRPAERYALAAAVILTLVCVAALLLAG